MAKKTDSKDKSSKPFDVSKPGETPASATSRPIIVSHSTMIKKDPMVRDSTEEDEKNTDEKPSSPPRSRQVKIEPLGEKQKEEPEAGEPEPSEESQQEPVESKENKSETTEAGSADKPKPEEKNQAKPEGGAVEALAGEVTAKREEQKQKEAAEAKVRELEKIIESKEFFVPIGQAARRRSAGRFVVILLLVIVLAIVALNFMVDAEVLDSGVEPLTDLL